MKARFIGSNNNPPKYDTNFTIGKIYDIYIIDSNEKYYYVYDDNNIGKTPHTDSFIILEEYRQEQLEKII